MGWGRLGSDTASAAAPGEVTEHAAGACDPEDKPEGAKRHRLMTPTTNNLLPHSRTSNSGSRRVLLDRGESAGASASCGVMHVSCGVGQVDQEPGRRRRAT